MNNELENLLSLLCQDARTEVKDGRLLIPSEIAKRWGDQIKKHKPEILLALGFCPECGAKLVVEIEHRTRLSDGRKETGEVTYCPMKGHFDKWEIEKGEGK